MRPGRMMKSMLSSLGSKAVAAALAISLGSAVYADPKATLPDVRLEPDPQITPISSLDNPGPSGTRVSYDALMEANMFNEPPRDGLEYILLKLHVRNLGTEEEAEDIGGNMFHVTGDNNVLYRYPYVVEPEPELEVPHPGEGVIGVVAISPQPKVKVIITMLIVSRQTQ